MQLRFPLRVYRFRGVMGHVSAIIIRDAAGRSLQIPCDPNPLRRDVARLWSPEEAEELAKAIARSLTDESERMTPRAG